jgi:rhodanese-related sulfurtransferase
MNDGCQTMADIQTRAGNCAAKQFFAILGVAAVLGLVYNMVTPLGVRTPKPADPTTSVPPKQNGHATSTNSAGVTNVTVAPDSPPHESGSALRWVEVKSLLAAGQIVLLDARAAAAYEIEHIPGALSLPAESQPAEFVAFVSKYPQNTAIVTYCGSDNCDLSHELAEKLRKDLGFTNVREMPGGIAEYRVAEGKPTPLGAK